MSKVVRSVKNVTKGYSHVQVKVRNGMYNPATSNDPWGPTGTEMSEIAQLTFNGSNDFYEIMDMLDKRMNDKGKNWRHVLKSLKVLDYSLHEGSELVVTWARKNVYIIKTLREFQYVDDDGKDVGQNVRTSAKELTSLILDEERLRTERSDRKTWKSRVTGIEEFGPQGSGYSGGETPTPQPRKPERRKQGTDEEDAEYRLAIEASKYQEEEDRKRRNKTAAPAQDDDLAKAIKLSKEEEELRRKELEESNAASLFDDTPAPSSQQPQYTGFNQGYQQQGAVDWFGNPVDQQPQQPQSTGYLNNAYSQPTGFQNQQTGFQNGFQPQQTGYDQSQFQQQQPNYLQPQQTVQPQQTAFDMNNPYAQQQNGFGNQFQQQQPQQQASSPTAGSHNPWTTNQQTQYDALKPMQTGSNNPFASARPQVQQQQSLPPTLSSLAEQKATTNFSQPPYNPIANYQAPQQTATQQKPMNPQHERLNTLLASGEGMDTFGNTGDLRIPSQHTAPGTFVTNSGQGLNKLHATQTGNNPFFNQQQFTGGPQQQGGFGQQQNRMAPAQTGPAGMNGFGGSPFGQPNNNPFGTQQSHQGQQQGGGSLIDL
ncbi:hypothetical protein OEA41_005176 [Lepraria neglecta]|uniref:ENTH domain-containing protein n=1 Tax=Lepraria neglecta TaxID=209136 RepID=A0AAD9Z393_9LECA|nr:hypothetical protein OEA41_005176 [Lepraria neglecta]